MSAVDWIRSRTLQPPTALASQVDEALGSYAESEARGVAAACLDAGVAGLASILEAEAVGRDAAIDLLAVDALVTYAFEAASEDVDHIDNLATEAMMRLAALAEPGEQRPRDP